VVGDISDVTEAIVELARHEASSTLANRRPVRLGRVPPRSGATGGESACWSERRRASRVVRVGRSRVSDADATACRYDRAVGLW
jgi:hypothetical protein